MVGFFLIGFFSVRITAYSFSDSLQKSLPPRSEIRQSLSKGIPHAKSPLRLQKQNFIDAVRYHPQSSSGLNSKSRAEILWQVFVFGALLD